MTQATKEDVKEVHERIDALVEHSGEMRENIAIIKTTLEFMPKPEARPCPTLTQHIADHKEKATMWQRPVVRAAIDLVKLGIVASLAFIFGRKAG